ncbi:hypothetical protein QWI17_10495 [Gilvimarinus sp. SDUM040013]|uniref:Uncharacterized protein n=1 Tax=Gilvimarinus gilvus TaxID=3058038 RepID=A0ABU4S1L0_9GAMM|nr:hypothetical protein [Gilvimarinus sp. SDUM040013]MDO3386267.1 hypothetical protein [Gilvimarinus sp. SDUM040013]MDX6849738.1 hypothetical protein [Gilvimarinus sp. SDUM040013]
MRVKASRKFWSQLGQSMAEYTVVMAALVGGLLVANRGACPDEYEDCIEYLLTVMHDNYDGYSASLSAVQEYATDYEVSESSGGWDDSGGDDDDDDDDGSSGGGDVEVPTVAVGFGTAVGDGTSVYGSVNADGEVINDGEVVGTYDSSTGEFTATDGTTESVVTSDVIVDEDGNILEREAVTDCDTGEVYAFGYRSEADGEFYDSLQYNEMDVSGYCTVATYKAEDADGNEDGGGRIVDGFYYAVTTTYQVAADPMAPEGEVVYFEDPDQNPATDDGVCVVLAAGWDSGLDPDDDNYYEDQLELLNNPPDGESLVIGYLDADYYTEQVMGNGEPTSPNDCVSNREITEP